jgi:hypothetical protein
MVLPFTRPAGPTAIPEMAQISLRVYRVCWLAYDPSASSWLSLARQPGCVFVRFPPCCSPASLHNRINMVVRDHPMRHDEG